MTNTQELSPSPFPAGTFDSTCLAFNRWDVCVRFILSSPFPRIENVDPETIWVLDEYNSTKQCNLTSSECFLRAEGRVPNREGMVCWLTNVQNKLWIMGGIDPTIENLNILEASPHNCCLSLITQRSLVHLCLSIPLLTQPFGGL